MLLTVSSLLPGLSAQDTGRVRPRSLPVRVRETDHAFVIPITEAGLRGRSFRMTHESHPGMIPDGCSVERVILHGGKSEGVNLVRIT